MKVIVGIDTKGRCAMQTIWKYVVPEGRDYFSMLLPKEAKILTLQMQNDVLCLWALVDQINETERRNFRMFGTGHPFDMREGFTYIGTFQLLDGKLVFHMFEECR